MTSLTIAQAQTLAIYACVCGNFVFVFVNRLNKIQFKQTPCLCLAACAAAFRLLDCQYCSRFVIFLCYCQIGSYLQIKKKLD